MIAEYTPQWVAEDVIDVLSENREWNAHDCHSYLVRNIGNTNATINGVMVLAPGEWFSSGNENPVIINRTRLKIEFDRRSDVLNASVVPGRDPYPANGVFDPTTANPRDNRLLILSSFLKPL